MRGMVRSPAAFAVLLTGALALGGCAATGPPLVAPRVELTSLTVLPSTSDAQRFRVSLMLDNMNTEPLVVNELRFMLRIASEGRINGASTQPFTLQALDQSTHTFTLESDIISSLSRLVAVQGQGNTVAYELFGNIELDRSFKNSLPFSARGEVQLSMSAAER